MATHAIPNKIKRSFTITPDSAEFLRLAREEIRAGSDSEALDMLLRELMLARKTKALEAAYASYYDSLPEESLAEEESWASMAGPDMITGGDL